MAEKAVQNSKPSQLLFMEHFESSFSCQTQRKCTNSYYTSLVKRDRDAFVKIFLLSSMTFQIQTIKNYCMEGKVSCITQQNILFPNMLDCFIKSIFKPFRNHSKYLYKHYTIFHTIPLSGSANFQVIFITFRLLKASIRRPCWVFLAI